VTQPPIVPGPQEPTEPVPPQVIYVQAPAPTSSRAVAGGIGIAIHWVLIVVIGVPALCCLGFLIIGSQK
jgi:hypothetical protein